MRLVRYKLYTTVLFQSLSKLLFSLILPNFMPNTILGVSEILFHLILITVLQSRHCYYSHFTQEEVEKRKLCH